jgi:hypothetical protein
VHETVLESGEQICMKFYVEKFYKELSGSVNFLLDWTTLTTTLHKSIHPFLDVSQVKVEDLLE